MKQTATFNPTAKTKFSTSHRKEKGGFHAEYAAIVPDDYEHNTSKCKSPVTIRLYWPGSVCYACIWVNGEAIHTSGSGSAGGGGYCKASAAAGEAIRNAGFTLQSRIDGVGTNAIEQAVLAIAAAVGYPEAMLHTSHA
jgi:hypothetical protein